MLEIHVPKTELFNEDTSEFIYVEDTALLLEYSLISISRWESKWRKAHIDPDHKPTLEETKDLIRCMTINKKVDPIVYQILPPTEIDKITKYINEPMTATTIHTYKKENTKRKITSEEIYYWMVSFGIPFDPCEKWHLNRLFALIEICAIKNGNGQSKMSKRESGMSQMELNERRLRELNTEG